MKKLHYCNKYSKIKKKVKQKGEQVCIARDERAKKN